GANAPLPTLRFFATLVIIPGHADLAGDVVIARGELRAGAGGVLAHRRAIQLLPRRLVRRVRKAALRLQVGMALLHLGLRDQDVGCPLFEIDAYLIAGLEDRTTAIGTESRRDT